MTTATKDQILALLDAFMRQRSGMEFANYGDIKSYRSEQRSITKDLHDARELLRYVTHCDGITADMLREAFRAYSGRLTLTTSSKGLPALDYCTGQYFPTEYRRAVCAVLAAAIWEYYREHELPHGSTQGATNEGASLWYPLDNGKPRVSAGDWLRTTLAREFGRSIGNRWFS
jgi:hypothetical protein